MTTTNIAAFTAIGPAPTGKVVPFVSINYGFGGAASISSRDEDGNQVAVAIPVDQLRQMARDLNAWFARRGSGPAQRIHMTGEPETA